MNILFVTGAFAKNSRDTALGGMERAVFKSAMGMLQLGHNVCILAADRKESIWDYHGIKVVSFRAINIFECINDVVLFLSIIDREVQIQKYIEKINKDWKIDIIQYTGWYGVGLLHFRKIPAIMRISSYVNLQFKDSFSRKREKLLSGLECQAVKRMDYVFAPSNLMAEKMEKDSGKNIHVIETPYVPENIDEDTGILDRKIIKQKYILFFGRLSSDKGIYVIRDILYKVLDKYRDIVFVFAGSGTINNGRKIETELREAAKEFEERVLCLGNLSKSTLLPIIRNAEFIVMPSIRDNLPNTCAEAMAAGKIIIGTDGSSLEQFITDGYNGLLAQIDNSDSLFKQINRAFMLTELEKERISQNAVTKIKELDIVSYSRKMQIIYQNLLVQK